MLYKAVLQMEQLTCLVSRRLQFQGFPSQNMGQSMEDVVGSFLLSGDWIVTMNS